MRDLAERTGRSATYREVFEPKWKGGPSGFAFPPRPFVLRPRGFDDPAALREGTKAVWRGQVGLYGRPPPLFRIETGDHSKMGAGKTPQLLVGSI